MMYWYGPGMNGWGYGLMAVGMVLFWGLVITVVIVLVRFWTRGGHRAQLPPPANSPEQLLALRYARGEIDEEEYQRRLAVLRGQQPPGPPAG